MITELMFWQFRIAILFILIFLAVFLPSRYGKWRTGLFLLGCFLVTGVMDYLYLIVGRNESVSLSFTLTEIVVLQSTPFLICKYRDFRAMFVGFTASSYVLAGSIVSSVLYITGAGLPVSLICQFLLQAALLGILTWKIRDSLLSSLENSALQWGRLCLIPAMFYIAVFAVSMWPSNIYEQPSNMLGVLCIVGIMVISYIMIFQMFDQNQKDAKLRQSMEYLENYAGRLKHEADVIQEKEREVAVLRHDLKHYSILINSYLDEGKEQEIRELLRELNEHVNETRAVRYCENLAVNSIITHSAKQAGKMGIAFTSAVEIPQKMRLNEFEFATVVANLLENAVNAAALVEKEEMRFIKISARGVKEKLILEISNSCAGEPEISESTGLPVSGGGERHGYGMQSVQAFVKKNGAVFDFTVKDHVFSAKMLVNI